MTTWLFESIMLICFGFSWPLSIAKTLRTRIVRGKSPAFMLLIITGYASGILHKHLNPPAPQARPLAHLIIYLYLLNLILVTLDLLLYLKYRNTPPDPSA